MGLVLVTARTHTRRLKLSIDRGYRRAVTLPLTCESSLRLHGQLERHPSAGNPGAGRLAANLVAHLDDPLPRT
jgi:hypothetical protein